MALARLHSRDPGRGESEAAASWSRPGLGLMIWTLVLFLFTMWVLEQGRLPENPGGPGQAGEDDRRVDRRRRTPAQGIRRAARGVPRPARRGARAGRRHHGPRPQSGRDGRVGGDRRRQGEARGAGRRRRSATSRPRRGARWSQIRKEVADLTVLATEKVTRKTLTEADQKRLVEEALGEVDFSALSGSENSERTDGRRRPRLRRGPLRGGEGQRQARPAAGAARPVRRRRRRRPRAAGLPLQPLPLLGRQGGRACGGP